MAQDLERIEDLLKYKKTGSGKLADRIVADIVGKNIIDSDKIEPHNR